MPLVGLQASQAMAHVEGDTLFPQALDPAAEERSGFHFLGVNAAGALLEGLDAELGGPVSEVARGKGSDDFGKMLGAQAGARIAGDEGVEVLAVGDIQAAVASDEEFAADRAFGIEDPDLGAASRTGFSSTEPGGASSDDGDVWFLGHGGRVRDETPSRQGRKVLPVLTLGNWTLEIGRRGGVDSSGLMAIFPPP